jgi:hypothetical protein
MVTTMTNNKILQYVLLALSVLITCISVGSAEGQAAAGITPSVLVHGFEFLLALALLVWVIYLRTKD